MSDPSGPILVVEGDRRLGEAITEQLIADGFAVELARSVEHARLLARSRPPQLALIGRLGSSRGAIALIEEIRCHDGRQAPWDRTLPAIVIGAPSGELDAVRALDAGADDFMARPAGYMELRARLRAVLRRCRTGANRTCTIELGALRIDTAARAVTVEELGVELRRVELRRMEYELLERLAREPNRVFAREELLRSVWRCRAGSSTRTVDSHASRLRRKLDPHGARGWVVTVWGVGYKLI